MPVRLLIVEDDEAIARPLVEGLVREGYEATWVATGAEALERAGGAELVLLDLGLPDIDGFDVLRELRRHHEVPVIVLTARGGELDRVLGLELGGDDYLVKPFGFRELVARIRAVMRRHGTRPRASGVGVGPLEVDRRTRTATLEGTPLALTVKEFDVLATLAEDPGAVVRRDEIFERVWGHAWYGPTKTLDVHVAALRKKLGDPAWIEAVRGVGFRLREP